MKIRKNSSLFFSFVFLFSFLKRNDFFLLTQGIVDRSSFLRFPTLVDGCPFVLVCWRLSDSSLLPSCNERSTAFSSLPNFYFSSAQLLLRACCPFLDFSSLSASTFVRKKSRTFSLFQTFLFLSSLTIGERVTSNVFFCRSPTSLSSSLMCISQLYWSTWLGLLAVKM